MITTANQLYVELRRRLAPATNRFLSLQQVEDCFNICNQAVMALQERIREKGFTSTQQEIYFFKMVKPRFTALQRYYILLYNHQVLEPSDDEERVLYVRTSLRGLHRAIANSRWLLKYYQADSLVLDQEYFTRHDHDSFTTTGEELISDRFARKMLIRYIRQELKMLQK